MENMNYRTDFIHCCPFLLVPSSHCLFLFSHTHQQQLQVAAEDLQSSMGDVLAASKPLIGQLEPLAANLIQSQTRLLSRDVLLLCQATSGKKKSLQVRTFLITVT